MTEEEVIYDDEAEMAVLGCMMEESKNIPEVCRILEKPELFYKKAHQLIYQAIKKVYEEDKTSDIMLVAKEIKRQKWVNRIGGLPYLYDLLNRVVDVANVSYYAEIVKENYIRRRLVKIGQSYKNLAYDFEKDITDVVDNATEMITALTTRKAKSTYIPDIMRDTFHLMLEAKEEAVKEKSEVIETGFYDLDMNHTVNDRGAMTTITADSGGGKTSMIRNIMLHRFSQGFKTLLFSTEETEERMATAFYSMLTGIKYRVLKMMRKNPLSKEQWNKIKEVRDSVDYMKGWIESGNVTVEYIKNRAREVKMEKGLDCLIVDYVQNIYSSNKFEGNRSLQIDYIVNQLKGLAVELDINVIIVSQLSMSDRRGQKGKKRDATYGEGAWSGGIRNNSDVLIRLRYTDLDPREAHMGWDGKPDPGILELLEVKIEKDRYAEYPVSYPIVFEKPTLRMRDVTMEEKEFFYNEWMNFDIDFEKGN